MFSCEVPFCDILVDARIIVSVLAEKRPTWPSDNSSRVRGLSDEMRALVETCWDQNQTSRPTATQIVQQLRVIASGRPDQRQQEDNHPSHATLSNQAGHPFATLSNNDSQIALVRQPLEKLIECLPVRSLDSRPASPTVIASREEDRPISQLTSLSHITGPRTVERLGVERLGADLSALVRIAFDDRSQCGDNGPTLQDITNYIRRDPKYPDAIVCRAGGDFYRAIYTWTDPRTLHVRDIKVNLTFPLVTSGS